MRTTLIIISWLKFPNLPRGVKTKRYFLVFRNKWRSDFFCKLAETKNLNIYGHGFCSTRGEASIFSTARLVIKWDDLPSFYHTVHVWISCIFYFLFACFSDPFVSARWECHSNKTASSSLQCFDAQGSLHLNYSLESQGKIIIVLSKWLDIEIIIKEHRCKKIL